MSIEKKVICANMLFINQRGEILFLRRAATVKHKPLEWCLPGGHYDATDENFLMTATREALEECGLVPVVVPHQAGKFSTSTHIIYYFKTPIVYPNSTQEINIDQTEHQQYDWLTIEEAIKDFNLIYDLKDHLLEMFSKT